MAVRIGRIVAEQVILDQHGARIDAQPFDATVEPEPHDVSERFTQPGSAPIQVRLLQ